MIITEKHYFARTTDREGVVVIGDHFSSLYPENPQETLDRCLLPPRLTFMEGGKLVKVTVLVEEVAEQEYAAEAKRVCTQQALSKLSQEEKGLLAEYFSVPKPREG